MPDRKPPYSSDGSFPNRLNRKEENPALELNKTESIPDSEEPSAPTKANFPRIQLPPQSNKLTQNHPEERGEKLPFISIIVAAPPGQSDIKAVTHSKSLAYPKDRFEIIVARGKQPSVQRNRAVKEAMGEYIYFLDDDSVPYVQNLIHGLELFKDPRVQVVGGPNLVPPESNRLEQSFGDVMGSWLAFGPSRARYRKVGLTRPSSEKELILCNMMFRKSAFIDNKGFDEALYPNEENALLDAIAKAGGKLIYNPEFAVLRRPRTTIAAFCKMLMNYGRGRAEQFRLHPTFGSAPNFVPPLFLTYLLACPFLPLWALCPLAAYAVVVALQVFALDRNILFSIPRLAPLIFMSHLFYGAGFWKGLFTRLKKSAKPANIEVALEKISPA